MSGSSKWTQSESIPSIRENQEDESEETEQIVVIRLILGIRRKSCNNELKRGESIRVYTRGLNQSRFRFGIYLLP